MIKKYLDRYPYLEHVLVIVIFAILTIVYTYPLAFNMNKLMLDSGSGVDAFIFFWNSFTMSNNIVDLQNPYYTNMIFHPDGVNFAFHTINGVFGVFTIPFLAGDWYTLLYGFNFIILLSFIAAGYFMYLLSRYLTGKQIVSIVAGIIFAYCNFKITNMVRLHIFSIEFLPLFTLFLLKFLKEKDLRNALLMGFSLSLILYSCLEFFGWVIAFASIFIFFWLIKNYRVFLNWRFWLYGLAGGLFFIVVSSPLLINIFNEMGRMSPFTGNVHWNSYFCWDVADLFLPNARSFLWGNEFFYASGKYHRGAWEFGLSIGISVVLLWISGMVLAFRERKLRFMALFSILLLISAMGPVLHFGGYVSYAIKMPYYFLLKVFPFLWSSRCPCRIIALALVFISVFAAFSLNTIIESYKRKWSKFLVFFLITAFIMMELMPIPLRLSKPFIPEMLWQVRQDDSDAVMLPIPINYNNHTSIFYQTVHRKAMMGRFTGMILHPSDYALDTIKSKEFKSFYDVLYSPGRFDRKNKQDKRKYIELSLEFLKKYKIKYFIIEHGFLKKKWHRIAKLLEMFGAVTLGVDGDVEVMMVSEYDVEAALKRFDRQTAHKIGKSFDFETGDWTSFTATGTAFGKMPYTSPSRSQLPIRGFEGTYFANSIYPNTDSSTGKLTSKKFVIEGKYLHLKIGGGYDPDNLYVALYVNDKKVISESGSASELMRTVIWDISSYRGQLAHIEIVDNRSGHWGHILADDIHQLNTLNDTQKYYFTHAEEYTKRFKSISDKNFVNF